MKKSKILSTLALASLLGAASIPLNIVTASHVYAMDDEEDFGDDGAGDEEDFGDDGAGDDEGDSDDDQSGDDQGDDEAAAEEEEDAAPADDAGDDQEEDAAPVKKAGPTLNTQAHKAVAIFNKKHPANSEGRHGALEAHIDELNALAKEATAPEDKAAKQYIKGEIHKLTEEMKKAGKKAGYHDHDAIKAYKQKEHTLKDHKQKIAAIKAVIKVLNKDMSAAQKAHDAKEESLLKHELADFKKRLADAEKAAKAAPAKGKGKGKDKDGKDSKGKKGDKKGKGEKDKADAKDKKKGKSKDKAKDKGKDKSKKSAKGSKSSSKKAKKSSSSGHKSSSKKTSSKHKK